MLISCPRACRAGRGTQTSAPRGGTFLWTPEALWGLSAVTQRAQPLVSVRTRASLGEYRNNPPLRSKSGSAERQVVLGELSWLEEMC